MTAHLGHTPDGQPVTIWTQVNAWPPHAEESFIEVGSTLIQVDHIEPGLEDALRASLRKRVS